MPAQITDNMFTCTPIEIL